MTEKNHRFPLTLSSVVSRKEQDKSSSGQVVATPQTAMRNSIKDTSQKANLASQLRDNRTLSGAPGMQRVSIESATLTSDGVRRAMIARLQQKGIRDELVLSAMATIPRHLFVESGFASQAYGDSSLPIGHKQTISQPYIVAYMIAVLRQGGKLRRVLEIGTGCGYQAAVLAHVADEVYSIERIKALHELAKNNLRELRIANLRLHYGDGMLGLPQAAPFDGIILAAAGMDVPDALLRQLAIGGRLIAPVGGRNQVLQLVQREAENKWTSHTLERCHFVPLHEGTV